VLTEYSEKEFREAVEKKLKKKVSDDSWKLVIETLEHEPYGKYDVLEAFGLLSKYTSLFLDTVKTKGKKGKKAGKQEKIRRLELFYWLYYWLLGWQHGWYGQDSRAKKLESWAEKYREILGFHKPVALNELKDALVGLGAKETPPSGYRIFYPRCPVYLGYIDVGILYCPRDAQLLKKVCVMVDTLVNSLEWHPAEVLAFLFCNITPLGRESVPRIYKQGKEITIKVRPNMKPDALARLYSKVRSGVIREIRGIKGKTARPRQASLRVQTLLDFTLENSELRGDARLREWNEKYPHWRYGNVHSLNAVISRAAKKELGRMELGIS